MSRQHQRRLWILSAVILLVFALYVGSVRLVAYHDDVYNIPIISNQTVLSVFDIRPFGHRDYRPVIAALWLLVRDGFGSFVPAMLHWWNLAVHTLTAALVMALALRLGRRLPMNQTALAAFAALLFAFFPFSYQAMLWAGAVGHPLMTMFGLMGAHAALSASERRSKLLATLSALFLLLACLSHEQGFVFGALIPLVVLGQRLINRERWTRWDIGLSVIVALVGAAYAIFYRFAIATVWVSQDYESLRATGLLDVLKSLAFNMQAFVLGVVVLLRYRLLDIFDASQVTGILYGLFALLVAPALIAMRWLRVLRFGLFALAFWFVALLPSAAYLSPGYIEGSPRILYPAAVGIALFWAALIAALLARWRSPVLKVAVAVAPVLFIAWSGAYVIDRMIDLDQFSRGVRLIASALVDSKPEDRVLLINFPAASGPKDPGPAFLLGNEGVMFHTDFNGSPFKHITALNGIVRPAMHVRHDASLRPNEQDRFYYFAAGPLADDGALRNAILSSNYIFRFEYTDDHERIRARHLATLREDGKNDGAVLGELSSGDAHVLVRQASAGLCGTRVQLQIEWANARNIAQPAGIFVHGFDAQGNQVLGADADLISGYLPLEQLPPNISLTETREIKLDDPNRAPAELRFGVYTREGVKRWRATRADVAPWEGDQIVVPVERGMCVE